MTTRSPRGPAFPSTRWSRILALGGSADGRRRDLEVLAQAYWRPMHAYLAARLRLRDDDARDLTQEAFAWMLATDFFARADPGRGRFRGLLKTALARFAIEHERRRSAARRGGGRAHEPIDGECEVADPHGRTPDQVLDDAWRRALLERARALLQEELEASGRGTYYALFRAYFLADDPGSDSDYRGLAARYGISTTDVSNWLGYAKRRYRDLLRGLVLDTVSSDEDLHEELRWLFGPAAPPAAREERA